MDFISDQTVTFIESVQKTNTENELRDVLKNTLQTLGVHYFTLYEFTGSTTEGVIGNYPDEWNGRYAKKRYEYLDPVALKLFKERKGFFWDRKLFETDGTLKGGKRQVFGEGGEFGLREGYAYLIGDQFGQAALTSFCAEKIDQDPKMLPAMHLISLYMHGKYKELTTKISIPEEAPYLTQRECECLGWAGRGKTNWEIAQILGVKETTIETHIQNAKRKLNVSSKMQAVIRSIQSGFVHI